MGSERDAVNQRKNEERGLVPGEKKEAMIQLSRETFGQLTGTLAFCFEGWKLRWEWGAASKQASKVYTDPSGSKFHLLQNLECYLGHQIAEGGTAAAAVHKLVNDAKAIEHLHADVFSQGTKRARDN